MPASSTRARIQCPRTSSPTRERRPTRDPSRASARAKIVIDPDGKRTSPRPSPKPAPTRGAARGGGYAVPAFNIFNLEMLQAALRAAEVERAPVIVQISPRSIAYAGLHPLAALATALAEEVPVPVVLHLDHGPGLSECRAALDE